MTLHLMLSSSKKIIRLADLLVESSKKTGDVLSSVFLVLFFVNEKLAVALVD